MITDSRNATSFKILTCSSDRITVQGTPLGKITYKQFTDIPPHNYSKLLRWAQLSHPHLLTLYKVHPSPAHQQNTAYGVYYEYFVGSLQHFISDNQFYYDQEEIVNTFQPIVEAIDYLCMHNFEFSTVRLSNIVITESQQVKYIDQSLLDPLKTSHSSCEKSKTYEQLSQLIFQFLLSSIKQKSPKSWKNRISLLKNKFSKQTFTFFMSVFNKSLVSTNEPAKNKKIAKKRKALQGKQNKILQPSA